MPKNVWLAASVQKPTVHLPHFHAMSGFRLFSFTLRSAGCCVFRLIAFIPPAASPAFGIFPLSFSSRNFGRLIDVPVPPLRGHLQRRTVLRLDIVVGSLAPHHRLRAVVDGHDD